VAGNGPGTGVGGPSEIDIERLVNEKSRMRLNFINRLILV
jgi:hypothetical protein